MSAIYRQHQDTRDGKIYNCVLMPDGKWWSAENLAWDGSGVSGIYGRLYTQDMAIAGVPPGSHLPIDAEWVALKNALGVPASQHSYPLRATYGWANNGDDRYGFAMLPGAISYGGAPISPGWGFYWSASPVPGNPANGYYLVSTQFTYDFGVSSGEDTVYRSVRFIVDVFNYPTYPTVSIYPASGTLQGVQLAVIQGQGTIRYTLDGSEPTASSTVYTGPFRLASSATVKAKAFQNSLSSDTATSVLVIQGADFLKIPSYTVAVLPYLLEQYKGDNP